MTLRKKMQWNPRRPVPVHVLCDAFNAVHNRLNYTPKERAALWDFAKNDNAKAYASYQSIINSWSHEIGTDTAVCRN